MRFSTAVFATVLAFGASALAGSLPPHEPTYRASRRDLARAILIARAPPNGDCDTASPSHMGAIDCHNAHGHGWKMNANGLQGNQFKGWCYF
ncbi:hypothetical protein CPB84DRAFT_1799037 [Gymnopilus junonius]|uniref:Uncharacterized protein n=1 Tax=Gymnopilus junonius TaxID=109634 RepID=A0A9P5TGN1_GYMJU|nr:hypothetical protein CPB84DRAFT_1799037 [Gymnopilus junonius]